MPQVKAKELKDLSIDELESQLNDTRKELFELKSERKTTKQLDKPHRLKLLKKQIARMLTVLTAKQEEQKN